MVQRLRSIERKFQFHHGTIGSIAKLAAGRIITDFNSTTVRLGDPDALRIEREIVISIPPRYDWENSEGRAKVSLGSEFQFHHGTIGRQIGGFRLAPHIQFQFHHGTIGRPLAVQFPRYLIHFNSTTVRLGGILIMTLVYAYSISIPPRYDWEDLQTLKLDRRCWISIPPRYDWEAASLPSFCLPALISIPPRYDWEY